jgi:hypothetical protein
MRRLSVIALLLFGFSSISCAGGAKKPFQIYDLSKGLDTYHDPSTLPEGFVQNSLNVLFDDKSPATKRAGYTIAWSTTSTFAFTNLWTYTDSTNTSWQIARSSTQITASNLAGSVVKITTVAASNYVGETNAFGRAYFVDQTQGLYYWNGTSTTYVTSGPHGSIITQFHNRLWVTGAAVPNGNQLYGSAYYDGNTWTTGLNATDPVQYSIGLQDNFDNVTAEYVYHDTLYIFKHYSIFALYGFDQTNFQISQLTQECGCIDGGSIQTYNGGLKFMSLRGVENFNGNACQRISDPVKDKVDPAIQIGGFAQQSWLQSTQTDWNAGTFTPTSSLNSSAASPQLVLSTGATVDNTSTLFDQGTKTNLSSSGNVLTLSTNNSGSVNNPDFEAGSLASWTSSGASVTTNQNGCTAAHGSYYAYFGAGTSLTVAIKDLNGNTLHSSNFSSPGSPLMTCTAWNLGSVDSSGYLGKRIKVSFTDNVGNSLTTSDSYILGGNVIFNYAFFTGRPSGPAVQTAVMIDQVLNGSSTISSGNFVSRTIDTLYQSEKVLPTISWTSSSLTPTFVLQDSSDQTSWTNITLSTGSSVSSRRYIRYLSTFTVSSTDDALSTLNSASFQWTASSGSFKSQIHNVGAISSWGNFSAQDTLSDGTIAFSICSSTNSNMGAPESCASQTANSQITISTGTYVQWFATFTVTAATQAPTLNSGTVQWFTGSNPVPMSSTVWDNRYWLSLTTTTTDSVNDSVLVLNSRGAWSVFDIHAGAFTQYKNSLYHADSLASGKIYLDNQGYGDNGNAINAFVRTRSDSLGGKASDDYLSVIYPAAANTGNCAMTVQYTMDKSTSTYSLGSPLLNEFGAFTAVRLPFPIDSSHMDFGQSIDFTIGTNDSSCAWNFYGLEGLYKERPVQ